MKKTIFKYCLFGIFLMVMMSECVYEDIPPEPVTIPDSVFFGDDIIPIFDANCNSAGCHNSGGIPPDLSPANAWVNLVFFQYVDTANVESSIVLQEITTGSMAQYASDQDIGLIKKWIEQGAQDN